MTRVLNMAFIITFALAQISLTAPAFSHESAFMRAYIHQALQGDLSNVTNMQNQVLSDEDRKYFEKFEQQIVRGQSVLPDGVDDALILNVMAAFKAYWRAALMDPASLQALENKLYADLRRALIEAEIPPGAEPRQTLKTAFADRNVHLLLGRTAPLLEFMAWRCEDVIEYRVELPGGVQPVTVHFMDDFISRGWLHFATFGVDGAGGWANSEGLFAMNTYDRASEHFQVSYLKHEAQHFADMATFPALRSADLEYRAKLTELIYARDDLARLLSKFTNQAEPTSTAPHPLANWHVMHDLTRALLPDSQSIDPESLAALGAEMVSTTATRLLNAHTEALRAEGAADTRGLLTTQESVSISN